MVAVHEPTVVETVVAVGLQPVKTYDDVVVQDVEVGFTLVQETQ